MTQNDDEANTSMSDAAALRAFQARMLAAQPQMAASQNQTGRRGSGASSSRRLGPRARH